MRGARPKHRTAECHPDRPHYARTLCKACYDRSKYVRENAAKRGEQPRKGEQPGLVKVSVPGWGSIA